MEPDVKEVIGILMHVLGGGEISREEVEDLAFEAIGDLEAVLNEVYIQLLEFAYDRDSRQSDRAYDQEMRTELQYSLDKIVQVSSSSKTKLVTRPADFSARYQNFRSSYRHGRA